MALTKDEEIIRRGCYAHPEIIIPSSDLMKKLTTLENTEIVSAHYKIHSSSLKEEISKSKAFFNENFKLHKVLTIKPVKIFSKFFSPFRPTNPFDLPLSPIESENIFNGTLVEFFPDNLDKVIFKEIILNAKESEHTSVQYVHEITHTQIDSLRGSLLDYYHGELLSIFLELVYALSSDSTENLLKLNDSNRVLGMLNISEELLSIPRTVRDELIEDSKYLCSSLKAYNLFISYYYGSNSLRKEMLKSVAQVFNGEITVEDMLNRYDVTYDNSQDEKKLMKYFNR